MHTELVERRRWISGQRFPHALDDCMLLPGPEAQPLATDTAWLMHRSWGRFVAGALFVLQHGWLQCTGPFDAAAALIALAAGRR